jgi:hypothetical protein
MSASETYDDLLPNTANVLQRFAFGVNGLPVVTDATACDLFFAASNDQIVVDQNADLARALAGDPSDAVQKRMIVSSMRGSQLPVGAVPGSRHQATVVLDAAAAAAGLWVTEMQTGCTVLILDWGGGRYSMIHLQPSTDDQFNAAGKKILGMGDKALCAYKNLWLKQELTSIVQSSNDAAPKNYIMIQSMFEASRGVSTQVLGVFRNNAFLFFRQRQQSARGATQLTVEELKWSTWRSYMPYLTY